MSLSINGKTIKSLMKDGKEIVKVERVEDGKILYEKQNNYSVATIAGSNVTLGASETHWLLSTGDVKIDWGDGTSDIVNDPTQKINHSYTDGLESHDIKIIGNVTSLGNYCFQSCDLLSIEISDTVTRLGNSCFLNCQNLTTVIIPNSVTKIESYCFNSCNSLTSITIPDGVTNLEMACVYNCIGLTSVSIPNSVTSIGYYCFSDCTALVDYQLYWTGSDILNTRDKLMYNIDTIFTIPTGETANYIAKGYPSNKLVERST